MDRIINFFKDIGIYDKCYFNYLFNNTKIINKPYREIKDFVGCFKVGDSCKLVLPKISNFYDELIYVHEYTHALFLDDELEIFPNLMEALYINKYVHEKRIKNEIIKNIYKEIENSVENNHKIGKKVKLISIKI